MSAESDFREISNYEKRVIDLLLAEEFPGRDELRKQVERCRVRTIDDEGSIEMEPSLRVQAPVMKTVPVEAYAEDSDGVMVHVLLHVKDGIAVELEFYKDDSSRILSRPNQWQVMVLPK
jgi:hypothetical protein